MIPAAPPGTKIRIGRQSPPHPAAEGRHPLPRGERAGAGRRRRPGGLGGVPPTFTPYESYFRGSHHDPCSPPGTKMLRREPPQVRPFARGRAHSSGWLFSGKRVPISGDWSRADCRFQFPPNRLHHHRQTRLDTDDNAAQIRVSPRVPCPKSHPWFELGTENIDPTG